ncbi:MAG: hotdog fold thioesterase [Pseudomonadota bacterium]
MSDPSKSPTASVRATNAPRSPREGAWPDGASADGQGYPPPETVMRWMADRNPVFALLDCEIVEVARGRTVLAMPMTDKVMNTFGAMHGGMIMAFADLCFGFTANSAQNERGVSSSAEIHWLAPGVIGDRLIGEATQVWRRGRNGLYDVTLWNERKGDTVAIVHGRMRFIGGAVMDDAG